MEFASGLADRTMERRVHSREFARLLRRFIKIDRQPLSPAPITNVSLSNY